MTFLTARESRAAQGIGKSMPRREDARLLAGAGQYANDFSLPGQAMRTSCVRPTRNRDGSGFFIAPIRFSPAMSCDTLGNRSPSSSRRRLPRQWMPPRISFALPAKGIAVSSSVYHIPTSHMRGVRRPPPSATPRVLP